MPTVTSVASLARRLAPMTAYDSAVGIIAPPEYLPHQVAVELMQHLHGEAVVCVKVTEDNLQVAIDAIADDLQVVALLDSLALAGPLADALPSFSTQTNQPRIVIAVESDRMPNAAATDHLVLGPAELVLTADDVRAIHPDTRDNLPLLQAILHTSGGVPALVLARGEHQGEVAQAWCERVIDQVAADPLLEIAAWMGRLAPHSFRRIGSAVLGEAMPENLTETLASTPLVTRTTDFSPAVPEALAMACRQALLARDPQRANELREGIARAALDRSSDLDAIARMGVLTRMRAWSALERSLAGELHVLAHLTTSERGALLRSWPETVPARLPALRVARAFIAAGQDDATVAMTPLGAFLPTLKLLEAGRNPHGSFTEAATQHVRDAHHMALGADLAGSRRALTILADWLLGRADSHGASCQLSGSDRVLLAHLLLLGSEAALSLGAFEDARRLTFAGSAVVGLLEPDTELHQPLSASATTHQALTLAVAGLTPRAAALLQTSGLDTAASLYPRLGVLVDLARRFVAVDRGLDQPPMTDAIDPDGYLAPLLASCEALRIAVARGPVAALAWARHTGLTATWSGRPAWMWWPLTHVVALLTTRRSELRSTEPGLGRTSVPEIVRVSVNAAHATAVGHLATSIDMSNKLLDCMDLTQRWSTFATALQAAALHEQEPQTSEELIASIDWSSSLGTLAVLPEPAQQLIVGRVPETALAAMPWLTAQPAAPASAQASVQLTHRQEEILIELATNQTMPQIAARLYVSPETVRSTAKQVYRALGVHDRRAAIEVAGLLGYLEPRGDMVG